MVIKIGNYSLMAAAITGWSVSPSGRELFVFVIGSTQPFIFSGPEVEAFLITMEKVYPQQVSVVDFAARLAALQEPQFGEVQAGPSGPTSGPTQQAVPTGLTPTLPESLFSEDFVRAELTKTMGGPPPEEVVRMAMEKLRKEFEDATRPPAKPFLVSPQKK